MNLGFHGVLAYGGAQLLTGIQVGVLAAVLVVQYQLSLVEALSISIPAGFPFMVLQGSIGLYLLERIRGNA